MRKLICTLLLAAFSLSTFAAMPPQQDTTRKTQKQRSKSKSKQDTTKRPWKKSKTDTMRRDTTKTPPVK